MLSPIKTNFGKKLKNKSYRIKFFRGQAQDEIAYQLRAARKKRKITQPKLEKLSGMKQSAISRLEQASYPHWNFQSLLCLADAMDLRVRVVLDYAEDVIEEYERKESAQAIESDNPYMEPFDTAPPDWLKPTFLTRNVLNRQTCQETRLQ